jgi:hypothetical protein
MATNTAAIGRAADFKTATNITGQDGVKPEAPPRERIERAASAPVEGQKAARLARCRSGNLRPFHDGDIDPALTEEVGGAGPDHAAAADHDPHGFLR